MRMAAMTVSPDILSGMPVFRGTRVPVKTLFDYLEIGEAIEAFFDDFPTVTRNQVLDVLQTAERLILEQQDNAARARNFGCLDNAAGRRSMRDWLTLRSPQRSAARRGLRR